MISTKNKFENIDEYISSFPKEIQTKLEQIRKAIKKAAPGAEEVISYQIPAFKQNYVLVYFAAFKNHIGFFPTSNPLKVFSKELSKYETSKGTIRFPLNKKIPFELITRITKYRLKEDLAKQGKKNKK
jgi:uncharacterized protein YdhG (YjbR/CyaY superfamily)